MNYLKNQNLKSGRALFLTQYLKKVGKNIFKQHQKAS